MSQFALFCLFILLSTSAQSKILISTVAQVKNQVITSREVDINKSLNRILGNPLEGLQKEDDTEHTIKIWLLYLEATSFYSSKLGPSQIQAALSDLEPKIKKNKSWPKLQVSNSELKSLIERRLEAERMYLFKRKASVLPVSASEIEGEYRQNRVRYEEKSLDDVREEIRKEKTMTNLNDRMNQWFVVLENKYNVQRFSQAMDKDSKGL